ncbi:carboxypeptidase regulatory-like domain-containing protein [Variovorax sp. J22P168]|uniref:carboxypeptidase regulatory-like domain-containing protein n=1 Tax=Variovorax jilinensis TaxID=3053513 RepID=UPI0025773FF2|nr:carboxypeptidase regulatory-like domain-containing protein [Variovorax sp. J22P168]MDM0014395.1 carboxypeptidase regulatory-like domain-containing protein [Variovorax sp. J22P168]
MTATPNRKPCPRLLPWLSLLLCGSLPLHGLAGELRGKVVVSGSVPAQGKVPVTIDQYLCGHEKPVDDLVVSANRELRNAVVWIETPPPGAPLAPRTEKVELDQKGCTFLPRIVIVPAGGTVEFLNSDRLLHNIHATPKRNVSFNRTQPMGRTIPVTFAEPEIVRINCDLHAWMTAWVVVAAHPWYAVTGADGRFAFDKLPPGSYKLQIWHERLGTVPASATVSDQQAAQLTVEMKAR